MGRKSIHTVSPGMRFGAWTVIERSSLLCYGRKDGYLVSCVCGETKTVLAGSLIQELSRSCGCKKGQFITEMKTRHGMTESETYKSWCSMIQRCDNPKEKCFPNYGGRGIFVCQAWYVFDNFLRDMGTRVDGFSLDRIDNNGGYTPENCRWASRETQGGNKRNNTLVRVADEIVCFAKATRLISKNKSTIRRYAQKHQITLQEAVDHFAALTKG